MTQSVIFYTGSVLYGPTRAPSAVREVAHHVRAAKRREGYALDEDRETAAWWAGTAGHAWVSAVAALVG